MSSANDGSLYKPYDQFILFGDSITQMSSNQELGFGFQPALQDGWRFLSPGFPLVLVVDPMSRLLTSSGCDQSRLWVRLPIPRAAHDVMFKFANVQSSLQWVYHRSCCKGVSKVLPSPDDSLCPVSSMQYSPGKR